ncbi:hypothetical protein QMK17_02525 [Rhodococcus sp. G-MC3]|uniref:hypothetical protein n=1 Tax=Rhodococcus sp. G-MC3 TaxID=3046209 RepID=UPI0024B9595C|nr:hypothetical protein [Rhodococcus sp. G-MC3]MDJ0392205.1 hypothetical protein [Rhodococcus sp. G-MC3]
MHIGSSFESAVGRIWLHRLQERWHSPEVPGSARHLAKNAPWARSVDEVREFETTDRTDSA